MMWMEGFRDIWFVLKRLLEYLFVIVVVMPCLLLSDLVCIPECVTGWLWKFAVRIATDIPKEEP